MNEQRRRMQPRWRWPVGACLLIVAVVSVAPVLVGQMRPLDPKRELAMKITAPFTLASVGDIIEMRPISQLPDPPVQSAIKIVRDADVAVANFEWPIADLAKFDAGLRRGWMGPKEVAADVKAMGFKMVNRANNAGYGSEAADVSTTALLDEVGIVHVGTGRDLQEARAARFVDTPKGRVGMVGMLTIGTNPATGATSAGNRVYGVDPLNLTTYHVVSQDQLEALRKVRSAVYEHRSEQTPPVELPANEPPDRLQLFGTWYKAGTTPGALSYTMNPNDLREILRSIRNGKYYSDFMIATIHTHEGHSAVQAKTGHEGGFAAGFEDYPSEYPPDFLVDLAHQCIDNGADAFVGHGVHVLRGVEIYKGKPIYYGLSDFVFQLNLTDPSFRPPDPSEKADATPAERAYRFWEGVLQPRNLEGLLATSRYDGGQLVEVRLYPMDLGYEQPLSRRGVAHMASGELARQILGRVQERSKQFGTTIAIEGSTGVIRVASKTPTTAASR